MSEVPGDAEALRVKRETVVIDALSALRDSVEKLEATTAGLVSKEYIETYQTEEAERRRRFALLVIGTCVCLLIMVGLLFGGYLRLKDINDRQRTLLAEQRSSLVCQAEYNQAFRDNIVQARQWNSDDQDSLVTMIAAVTTDPKTARAAIQNWLSITQANKRNRDEHPLPEIPKGCSP